MGQTKLCLLTEGSKLINFVNIWIFEISLFPFIPVKLGLILNYSHENERNMLS